MNLRLAFFVVLGAACDRSSPTKSDGVPSASVTAPVVTLVDPTRDGCEALMDMEYLRNFGAVTLTQPDKLGRSCQAAFSVDGKRISLAIHLDNLPGHRFLEEGSTSRVPIGNLQDGATFNSADGESWVGQATKGRSTVTIRVFSRSPVCQKGGLANLVRTAISRLSDQPATGPTPAQR
jgi:hypothetical protein